MKSCLDLSSASADNTSKPIILSLTAALFVVRPLPPFSAHPLCWPKSRDN